MAERVALSMGLDYLPSGFQARFEDSKGLWSIHPASGDTADQWIEVCDSQRKWKREDANCPDFDDPAHCTFEVNAESVKHGVVPFAAGLPAQLAGKLALLLESGFDPMKLKFLRDMATQFYWQECDDLKTSLKIVVYRSTYAYMVPDFSGVLEPVEVYIHLSTGKLESPTGFPIRATEMLVTRSPAHFGSDIQKVKGVFKPELAGLQDVNIFSTKGNPSLAQKLSSGDHDGDKAWIYWEPDIVSNFTNAEVPVQPDQVQKGFVEKTLTTHKELVANAPRERHTSVFLRNSFESI
ncbi:RNA dependent RNA polymerase-domain-containing protein [Calycina marina]|uniref:RNA-dependent RNA polymerase n=1 Tax=Calycina marina TaxID=1763456 RepID=A0A9P7YW86_9HELO|nr:RNA dependent RNA polymerase-domain-containing protein [Calycina marina]